jgi:hypothetical protein
MPNQEESGPIDPQSYGERDAPYGRPAPRPLGFLTGASNSVRAYAGSGWSVRGGSERFNSAMRKFELT